MAIAGLAVQAPGLDTNIGKNVLVIGISTNNVGMQAISVTDFGQYLSANSVVLTSNGRSFRANPVTAAEISQNIQRKQTSTDSLSTAHICSFAVYSTSAWTT